MFICFGALAQLVSHWVRALPTGIFFAHITQIDGAAAVLPRPRSALNPRRCQKMSYPGTGYQPVIRTSSRLPPRGSKKIHCPLGIDAAVVLRCPGSNLRLLFFEFANIDLRPHIAGRAQSPTFAPHIFPTTLSTTVRGYSAGLRTFMT